MRRKFIGLAAFITLAGCATVPVAAPEEATHVALSGPEAATVNSESAENSLEFTPAQKELLTEAVRRANLITSDSTFASVMRAMEAAGEVRWRSENLRELRVEHRARPTSWLLERFARDGNYALGDIRAGKFKSSNTTGGTDPCGPYVQGCPMITYLAPWYVSLENGRTVNAFANTLVHERTHSFGQKHIRGQKRKHNLCDAAYLMGDLAEALLRRREEGSPIEPREDLCRSLEDRLRTLGVVR